MRGQGGLGAQGAPEGVLGRGAEQPEGACRRGGTVVAGQLVGGGAGRRSDEGN